MSRFSTREGFMILFFFKSKFCAESYGENRFKIGKKVSGIQLVKLGTPKIKVLRKMHLNFRKIVQKSGDIIKKNTLKKRLSQTS